MAKSITKAIDCYFILLDEAEKVAMTVSQGKIGISVNSKELS